jgi:hypothetical protein
MGNLKHEKRIRKNIKSEIGYIDEVLTCRNCKFCNEQEYLLDRPWSCEYTLMESLLVRFDVSPVGSCDRGIKK